MEIIPEIIYYILGYCDGLTIEKFKATSKYCLQFDIKRDYHTMEEIICYKEVKQIVYNKDALYWACIYGHIDILKVMANHYHYVDTGAVAAAIAGNLEVILYLMNNFYIDIDKILNISAENGHLHILEYFIDYMRPSIVISLAKYCHHYDDLDLFMIIEKDYMEYGVHKLHIPDLYKNYSLNIARYLEEKYGTNKSIIISVCISDNLRDFKKYDITPYLDELIAVAYTNGSSNIMNYLFQNKLTGSPLVRRKDSNYRRLLYGEQIILTKDEAKNVFNKAILMEAYDIAKYALHYIDTFDELLIYAIHNSKLFIYMYEKCRYKDFHIIWRICASGCVDLFDYIGRENMPDIESYKYIVCLSGCKDLISRFNGIGC